MTPQERQALMTVRDKLRSGEIPAELFDMTDFGDDRSCGTAHCIGGWMAFFMRKTERGYDNLIIEFCDSAEFSKLFFARAALGGMFGIEPHQAAQAIDNFLADGDPKWREVMTNDV